MSDDDELLEQTQFAAVLESADPMRGLELRLDDGTIERLPPDVSGLEEAAPGEYRLRSTGETVVDPDYVLTWTVTRHDS